MTTIAVNRTHIAADGRSTWNEPGVQPHIHREDRVKLMVGPDWIYAFAGETSIRDTLMRWHLAGAKPEDVPASRKSWAMLIVASGQAFFFDDGSPYPTDIRLPFAMGTGESFAMGAMDAGASPEEAVRIAAARDPFTGGAIISWDIAKVLGQPRLGRTKRIGAKPNGHGRIRPGAHL